MIFRVARLFQFSVLHAEICENVGPGDEAIDRELLLSSRRRISDNTAIMPVMANNLHVPSIGKLLHHLGAVSILRKFWGWAIHNCIELLKDCCQFAMITKTTKSKLHLHSGTMEGERERRESK